jgi:hypothetical protein
VLLNYHNLPKISFEMAITIQASPQGLITIQEYCDCLCNEFDLTDDNQVLESAPLLASLASTKSVISDFLNQQLKDSLESFQSDNRYTAATLVLAEHESFVIRANMWLPIDSKHIAWSNSLYSYGEPHDHNFSFLTIGFLGSGYGTNIHEYSYGDVSGYVGESVNMRHLEHTSLPAGKLMFYRASKDIHTQEAPKEFSVSLNLILVRPEENANSQYYFNTETKQISGFVPNINSGRESIIGLARYVGDNNTIDLLLDLASSHPQPRLRWAAYKSLSHLCPNDALSIFEQAAEDKCTFVSNQSRQAIYYYKYPR